MRSEQKLFSEQIFFVFVFLGQKVLILIVLKIIKINIFMLVFMF